MAATAPVGKGRSAVDFVTVQLMALSLFEEKGKEASRTTLHKDSHATRFPMAEAPASCSDSMIAEMPALERISGQTRAARQKGFAW